MATLKLTDAPLRRLLVLAAITLLAILAAALAAFFSRERVAPPEAAALAFPGLEAGLEGLERIEVQDKDDRVEIRFRPGGGWVVMGESESPARYESVENVVTALLTLERSEKRTALAKWHERLALAAPEAGGAAKLVRLSGKEGTILAEILFGTMMPIGGAEAQEWVYARAPGEDQVWLMKGRGLSEISAAPAAWLETLLIDLPAKRTHKAIAAIPGRETLTVIRPKPEDPNFTLEPMPEGMQLKSPVAANGIGAALIALQFKQMAPAGQVAFDGPAAITYETFDGLMLLAEVTKLGDAYWLRLTPSALPTASEAVRAEVAALEKRFAGRIFEIASWKAAQMMTPLSEIVEPAPAEEAAP